MPTPRPAWRDDNTSEIDPLQLEAIGRRIRYADVIAPDMSQDPAGVQGIMTLAQQAPSDEEFERSVMEAYGFNESGKMAADLAAMPADMAYIRFHQLPKAMQAAVRRQGFEPEEYGQNAPKGDGKPSGIFGSLPLIGGAAQAVTGFVGEEIVHPAAAGMTALGNEMTQFYRALKATQQEDGELATFNPWTVASHWGQVENGMTYVTTDDRATLRRDYDLSNEELDTYLKLSQGVLPGELAEDDGFAVGTPEHIERVQYYYDLASSEKGQELIGNPLAGNDGMINNYRVSFGRAVARGVGFQPEHLDDGLGRLISGSGDLAYAVLMDPTLAAGKIYKGTRLAKIALAEGADIDKAVDAATFARKIMEEGWTQEARVGLPGLRNVIIRDADGVVQAEMAMSRLALGKREANAIKLINEAFDFGNPLQEAKFLELMQAHPGLMTSWDALVDESLRMAKGGAGTPLGIDRRGLQMLTPNPGGLADAENLEQFLKSSRGYRILTETKFGGKNTAEFLRLPEIGRSTEVKMRAKGFLARKQDWANGIDAQLAKDIGVAPGRGGQILRNVVRYPHKTIARTALGLTPGVGRFSQIATTHVPRTGAIGLWGKAEDLPEFNRYLQFGKAVGMDDAVLNRYLLDFAGTPIKDTAGEYLPGAMGKNAAMRGMVVRNFTVDLLSHFDIGEGSELYRKFVGRMDEVFGLTKEHLPREGNAVMLAQTADAVAIPSYRDLIMATNRYSTTRSIFGRGGFLNPQLPDTLLTRYWKPAVLMRLGFVGRAAGEELLAYLARFGSAHHVGITLAQDVAKRNLYDRVFAEMGDNWTREILEDLRTRTPDKWEEMIGWAGRKGPAPSATEVLTWGQSQALAPFTGVIHSMDAFTQKVLLAPYANDLSQAPRWMVRAGDRMRAIDNAAFVASFRTKKALGRASEVARKGISKTPGLQATGAMLDATLHPIITKLGMDLPTFKTIAEQGVLPTKAQAAKLLAHLGDEDFKKLEEMLTDPFVRKAHLEHVVGAELYNVGLEPDALNPQRQGQLVDFYNPKTKRTEKMLAVPEGNKTVTTPRPEGAKDGQRYLDFYHHIQDRVRGIWNHKMGTPKAILEVLPNHIEPSLAREIAAHVKAAGLPGGGGTDLELVAALAREIRNLPYEQQQILLSGIDNSTFAHDAADLAAMVTGDSVEEVLQRTTLKALSGMRDLKAQRFLFDRSLNPDKLHSSFERMEAELEEAVRRLHGRPAAARVTMGQESFATGLQVPPIQDHIPAYGIAADATTATWATQHLVAVPDPALREAFVADMAPRLRNLGLPALEEVIADEIFSPNTPMSLLTQTFKANQQAGSIPVSMIVSPNPDLADDIAMALSTVTGKKFHLQGLNIPEEQLAARFKTGTGIEGGSGARILDGQGDWQESILWRSQMDDFAGATPLPNDPGARRYLVKAPTPNMHVYDREFGPPLPEFKADVTPTTMRWEPDDLGDEAHIDDILDSLPDPEPGKLRIYGTRSTFDPDEPITWYPGDPVNNIDQEVASNWYFADVPEAEYTRLVDEGRFDATMGDLSDELNGAEAHHFATDGEVVTGVDADGNPVPGYRTKPESFEYTALDPAGWKPGLSPTYFVAENEDTLRRLAVIDAQPLDELDDATREVARRLGIDPEALVGDTPANRLVRQAAARKADEMLIEGRKANMLPKMDYVYEDELDKIVQGLGGPHDVRSVTTIFDEAEALTRLSDDEINLLAHLHDDPQLQLHHPFMATFNEAGAPRGPLVDATGTPTVYFEEFSDDLIAAAETDLARWQRRLDTPGASEDDLDDARIAVDDLGSFLGSLRKLKAQERLAAAKAVGGDLSDEAVAARRAATEVLDQYMPGWRGSEGWDRIGTREWFGLEDGFEPVADRNIRKHIRVGLTPGEKSDTYVKDQVEEIIRHFTNGRSETAGEHRVLHEMLSPLSVDPSLTRIDMDLVMAPPIEDMPLATYGPKFVTPRNYAWDRLTNFFFDDVAAKGIASIVRNQLFATNYLKASRLAAPLHAAMINPALREKVKPIATKMGTDIDGLDEYIRLHRNGMVAAPYAKVEPWNEVLSIEDLERWYPGPRVETDTARFSEIIPTDEGAKVIHRNEFEMERDAITAVQNSAGKVPGPEVSLAHANEMLRKSFGIEDTPLRQEIRKAQEPVTKAIIDEQNAIRNRILDAGGSNEEVMDTIKAWRKANKEAHDAAYAAATEEAKASVAAARGASEQLTTDPVARAAHNAKEATSDPAKFVPDEPSTDLSGPEFATLRHYINQQTNALDTVRDATIGRALEGTIPFIDDHRIRSQFQEYVGNLVPFWFAEEQFLKRWVRIFKEAPDAFRKGQLAMHGLRTIGAIKKDEQTGREYYIYPGSAAATSFFSETPVAKLLFGSEASLPVGLSMTGDVGQTLPGFGDQMGVPSAGPFVGMALEMLASRSPEWAKTQEAVMGPRGSNRQLFSYLVPTTVSRFYSAFTNNLDEPQLASALIETAQLMEATGHGLPENATPDQEQEYLDQVEANARSVMLLRAGLGFVTPASPGIDNSESLPLSDEFESLIQSGVPYTEALMMFQDKHDGDISPYTVFRSEVPSNAPLAATHEALTEMDAYADELKMFPMAAPWLLLPFRATDDEFDNRAYRWQIRYGLRKYRSHKEYIRALAWADASPEYFDTVEDFDTRIEGYRLLEQDDLAAQLEQEKAAWAQSYRNAHPLFSDKLISSEGRAERQQILRESYLLIDHPRVQTVERLAPMREMLQRYREYSDMVNGSYGLGSSRAKAVVEQKEMRTMEFQSWLGLHLIAHPELRYFYDRVLRPELRWDRSTMDEGLAA